MVSVSQTYEYGMVRPIYRKKVTIQAKGMGYPKGMTK